MFIGNQITKNIIYAAPNTYYLRGVPGNLQANESEYFNLTQTGFVRLFITYSTTFITDSMF